MLIFICWVEKVRAMLRLPVGRIMKALPDNIRFKEITHCREVARLQIHYQLHHFGVAQFVFTSFIHWAATAGHDVSQANRVC